MTTQGVSKGWLDFLRNRFPAGSRIQIQELDDPRNTLEEAGILEYIDDSGRFHVRQSDRGGHILILGEEMLSVHPPESTQLRLYMPLTASFYARNERGDRDEMDEEWDGRTLLDYGDRILGLMVWNRVSGETGRGLILWCDKELLDVKVRSAALTAEARNGGLWDVAECQAVGQLFPRELTGLKDYLAGQTVDDVSEGLEQQATRVDGGELYAHIWQPGGWSVQTGAEQFGLMQVQGMTTGGMSRGQGLHSIPVQSE